MPRIDFTAPLIVTDAEGHRLANWSSLSQFVGRSFENTDILGYFGQSIDEVPVAVLLERSGDIHILANPRNDGLLAKSSLRSSRTLSADELEVLQNHVEGTWSDGVGECLDLDEMSFYIDLDCMTASRKTMVSSRTDREPAICFLRSMLATSRTCVLQLIMVKTSMQF